MFGKTKTADEIVAIFTKTVSELRGAAVAFGEKAVAKQADAVRLQQEADEANAEAAKASRYADKISTLFDDDDANDAI